MSRYERFRQTEGAECGLACLAFCAEHHGLEIDLPWLRQRFPSSMQGSNLRDLAEIAATLELSTRAVRCELDELKELAAPAILHWNLNHFVVLEGVKQGRAQIFDPATGRRTIHAGELGRNFSGIALELSPSPRFTKRRERSQLSLFSLVRWLPSMKAALLQALLLSVLLEFYVVVSPLYMQIAIDGAALKGDSDLIKILAIGFGLFALFNAGAEFLRGLATQRMSSILNWDITQRLFHHMIRLPLSWFERRQLSDALTRFQSVDGLKNLIANGLVATLVDGILSIGTLVMMAVFNPLLTVISVGSFLAYVGLRLTGIPMTRRLGMDALQANIAEQGKRIETLRGIRTIKAMNAEVRREGDWANRFSAVVRTTQRNAVANMTFSVLQRVFEAVGQVIVVYLGVLAIIGGHMTVGLLYAFMAYRTQFMQRSVSLFEQIVSWRMLEMYTFRVADIVLSPMEPNIDRSPVGMPPVRGSFEFRRVSFRYSPASPFILHDASFQVEEGEFVAIVGPSGVGKSTLLKLLCGLYAPTAGSVHLDGFSLETWGLHAVRRSLGVVLQDDELFPGSIAENVAFFDEEIEVDHVWDCLRIAGLTDEIEQMPMRLETLVGDMGSSLSGGQVQRLVLARALYRRPKILLLDEATSHLDVSREAQVTEALSELRITRIVVAHRPETIRAAGRVVALSGGKLVELKNVKDSALLKA